MTDFASLPGLPSWSATVFVVRNKDLSNIGIRSCKLDSLPYQQLEWVAENENQIKSLSCLKPLQSSYFLIKSQYFAYHHQQGRQRTFQFLWSSLLPLVPVLTTQMIFRLNDSQSAVPGPTATAVPGKLLEMQIPGSHSWSAEPSSQADSDACWSLKAADTTLKTCILLRTV